MDWRLFASTYALIAVAELPGKTTMTSALLASRSRPLPIFAGAAAAFVVHSAIAVAAGRVLAFLPPIFVQTAAGLLFLVLAALVWRQETVADAPIPEPRKVATTAFAVTFLAQWGDPTQLATAAMAARHDAPVTVFCAATAALWTVSGLAAWAGHHAGRRLHPERLRRAAALVFAAVGLVLLWRASGTMLTRPS